MNENKLILKQLFKNMFYNLIAFTILFVAFGVIALSQVRVSLYLKLDDELKNAQKMMVNLIVNENLNFDSHVGIDDRKRKDNLIGFGGPRVIPLLRNKDGQVVNFGSVNNTYFEQYLKYITFNQGQLFRIIPITVQNRYYFRSLTIPVSTKDGKQLYLQLLINADSERALLSHISFIIFFSSGLFIVLSILASYLLSQKTMSPIRKAWYKQAEFVENVSHELRTPLTIIQNSLESLMISSKKKIMDQSETLALVYDETSRLSKLVTDMLTLARSGGMMTEITKDVFSLDHLIKIVSEPYIELAESQQKSFQLDLNCPTNIDADKSRIHQLLVILFDNALKYTNPHDSITIQSRLKDNKISLIVSDTGIGISDEAINKIFDRFYREDRARALNRSGTGLGLSIASWIVQRHGGTIKVRHNEPKGTIFTIKIPI
ncbi:MAG: HAMP domain-containing histidine kinase [Clostridiales bacterium]|nr:HAMP domain-containing histidine kinase [Clostridiales bacterium]